jgi:hypothetical protein
MAELTANVRVAERSGSFFMWMATFCAFLAFGGFSTTYFIPMAEGTLREVTPAVHIHGILFFGWTLVFLLQATLVSQGKVALHRSIGMAGISLATAMVIMGLIVNWRAFAGVMEAGAPSQRSFMLVFSGTQSMVLFATLFGLAIANIRRSDVHKRLMLFATTMILAAAVSRLWGPVFGGEPGSVPTLLTNATVDVIVVAALFYDWRTLGRVHGATIVGGVVLVGSQITKMIVPSTEAWQSLAPTLVSLVS